MPYSKNSELPDSVRNVLPAKAQTVFRNVVNSQLKRGLKESRAFRSAWGALRNQGWQKGENGMWHHVGKTDDITIHGSIAKAEDEQQLVFGWASIIMDANGNTVTDKQGDTITPEELEKMAYDFVRDVGLAGEMHKSKDAGKLVESLVLTKDKQAAMGLKEHSLPVGWWVGFKVNQEVFEKVKSGEYSMFSIGGKGRRTAIEEE